MYLRVAGNNDAEIVAIALLDEGNELCGVCEAIFNWLPVVDSHGRIATQRENVTNTVLLGLVQRFDDAIACHAGASEMHKYIQAHVLGDMAAKIQSCVKGAATGAPGNINPQRIGSGHTADSFDQIFLTYQCYSIGYLPEAVFGGKYS